MKNLSITLFVLFITTIAFGQKKRQNWATYTDINGNILYRNDSLSFKNENDYAEFFVTDSMLPYTGTMYINYGENAYDSTYVRQGFKHGLSKEFRRNDQGNLVVTKIVLYNYFSHVLVSQSFYESLSNRAFLRFYDPLNNYNIIAYNLYFKSKRIHLIKKVNGKKVLSKTFDSASTLKNYLDTIEQSEIFPINSCLEIVETYKYATEWEKKVKRR